jgi:uncharacterized membrane protein YdjX (TVP38/TMEM64 family)
MVTEERHPVMTGLDRYRLRRVIPIVVLIAGMLAFVVTGWSRHLSFETLVIHRAVIDQFIAERGGLALLGFVTIYVVVVALSIPGALVLTVAGGILFGWLGGGLAAITGATVGATLVFLVARSACGEALVRRAGPRLTKIAEGVRADALSYLLFLRLVPVFPFWLVNLAPALVGVRLGTFVLATALGIIPGTFAFTLVGAGFDSVIRAQGADYRGCLAAGRSDCRLDFDIYAALTPQVIAALLALGVLALIPAIIKHCRGAASGRVD